MESNEQRTAQRINSLQRNTNSKHVFASKQKACSNCQMRAHSQTHGTEAVHSRFFCFYFKQLCHWIYSIDRLCNKRQRIRMQIEKLISWRQERREKNTISTCHISLATATRILPILTHLSLVSFADCALCLFGLYICLYLCALWIRNESQSTYEFTRRFVDFRAMLLL